MEAALTGRLLHPPKAFKANLIIAWRPKANISTWHASWQASDQESAAQRALHRSHASSVHGPAEREVMFQTRRSVLSHQDFQEAARAFTEKRKPANSRDVDHEGQQRSYPDQSRRQPAARTSSSTPTPGVTRQADETTFQKFADRLGADVVRRQVAAGHRVPATANSASRWAPRSLPRLVELFLDRWAA